MPRLGPLGLGTTGVFDLMNPAIDLYDGLDSMDNTQLRRIDPKKVQSKIGSPP